MAGPACGQPTSATISAINATRRSDSRACPESLALWASPLIINGCVGTHPTAGRSVTVGDFTCVSASPEADDPTDVA